MYKTATAASLLVATSAERIPLIKRELTTAHLEASMAHLNQDFSAANGNKIHIKDYMNTQYMAKVSVGTPAQEFTIIPDTGSSNIWFYDSDCQAIACMYHHTFKHDASKTFHKDGSPFVLHYGSGGVTGVQAYDNVGFGATQAKDFHLGMIEQVDAIAFLASDMEGIVGLAWPEISMYHMPVYVDQALPIDTRFFSFYMHTNPAESYMMFPGIDESVSALSDFEFHKVTEQRYWSIQLDRIGDADLGGLHGVIDSGTSLLVGDQKHVDAILNGATVAQDCSDMDQLKTLDVVFNGVAYPLEPEDYVIKITQGGESQCVMGIMGAQFPEHFPYFIVGDVFMRKYPTVFDRSSAAPEGRVGFLRPEKKMATE